MAGFHRSWCMCIALGPACLALATPARAALVEPGFEEVAVAKLPTGITSMAWAPDASGRLFVTRKTGEVLIVQDGQLLDVPFATLAPLFVASECGLLGIAFDPDFSQNGYVYFFATVSSTEQQIFRYTADGDTGQDGTVLISGLPTRGRNHNGGALGFGPDGKLYWAIGDNGARLGGKTDLTLLASKVGRAAADGSVPSDNPFVDGDGPNNDYIWALGLRNPFTFTWQPGTDKLWVNVVGARYEQAFTMSAGDHAGWDVYESYQSPLYIQPAFSYPTDVPLAFTIVASGAVREAGVTTITTQQPHRLQAGGRVNIAGVANASFDGSVIVTESLSNTQFTFAQPGPDAVSGGGTATGPAIGGCITGGAFLDSSAVPPAYRGNFFFGDYNSGRIERALIDPKSNAVMSIEPFANGLTRPIDIEVGPDGDLYYVGHIGALFRARFTATANGLVVSHRHVRVAEGGRAYVSVRLLAQPAADVTVSVARAGDGDVGLEAEQLVFTSADWDMPQPLELSAEEDADIADDEAELTFSASGLAAEQVAVSVTDNDLVPGASAGAGAGGQSGGTSSEGGRSEGGIGAAAMGETGGVANPAPGEGGMGARAEGGADVEGGPPPTSDEDSGCSCSTASSALGSWSLWGLAVLGLAALRRRA